MRKMMFALMVSVSMGAHASEYTWADYQREYKAEEERHETKMRELLEKSKTIKNSPRANYDIDMEAVRNQLKLKFGATQKELQEIEDSLNKGGVR